MRELFVRRLSLAVFILGILGHFPLAVAESASKKAAVNTTPEILTDLSKRFKQSTASPFSDVRTAQLGLDETGMLRAEMHLTFLPPTTAPLPFPTTDTVRFPIPSSLIAIIDSTPRGGAIRVATYMFAHTPIKNALVKALGRGVRVFVLTSDEFRISDRSLAEKRLPASPVRAEVALRVKRELQSAMAQAGDGESFFAVCENKTDLNSDPGGCLGNHLMHHKFSLFSSVCRFGLRADGYCKPSIDDKPHSYKKVVFQGSENYVYGQYHEAASVFFGYTDLYNIYFRHFYRMHQAVSAGPDLSSTFGGRLLMGPDSELVVNFAPRARVPGEFRESDLLLSRLEGLDCGKGDRRTLIRVANTHWSSKVAFEFVRRFKELRAQGCVIRVMLPRDMDGKTSGEVDAADAEVYRALRDSGVEVRTFAHVKANPVASIHSKYVLILPARGPATLMFGTLSFTGTSQKANDEAWLVWRRPSRAAWSLYSNSFEQLFAALPEVPLRGELDYFRVPTSDLVGYWKLNGTQGVVLPDGEIIKAARGPDGVFRNLDSNLENAVQRIFGFFRQALDLDGKSTYVSLPHEDTLAPTAAITLSALIKPRAGSTSGPGNIISKAQEGGYQLYVEENRVKFLVQVNQKYHEVSGALPAGNVWTQVTGAYDGRTLTLYVNGVVASAKVAPGAITYKYKNRLCFGRGSGTLNCGGSGFYQGAVDEIAIFKRALTPGEIYSLHRID